MRKYTLLFSIVAHAAIVGAVFVVTMLATDVLPTPWRSTKVMLATVVPPSPPVRMRQRVRAVATNAAPIAEPPSIGAEPPPELRHDLTIDDRVGLVHGLTGLGSGVIGGGAEPPPPPPLPQPPMRIGGTIKPPQRIHDVAPLYPEIARSARVSGVVILEAVIAEDGSVRDVRVLRSIPLLDRAAIDAVRQWRFTPTLLNGQAIPVVMTVTVMFALN
jgi:periplasmic protein TonB